jgi:hypothetical protein
MQTGRRVVIFQTEAELSEVLELAELEVALVDQLAGVVKRRAELLGRVTIREVTEGGLKKAG